MLPLEKKARKDGFLVIIGIDEAGRGPLAGPVVASAVFLKEYKFKSKIADSKKISPQEREEAFHEIWQKAHVGVGIMNESVIDQINILQATYLAMNTAVRQLMVNLKIPQQNEEGFHKKVCLFVDGNRFKNEHPYTYKTIIDGDEFVLSIACASIVAKVIRDRILNIYDRVYPQYGFGRHKGYATLAHKRALKEYGPSVIHRRSFHPDFSILSEEDEDHYDYKATTIR